MPIRKFTIMLFCVNGLQLFFGAVLLVGLHLNSIEMSESLLIVSLGLVFLSSLFLMIGTLSVYKKQYNDCSEHIKNVENLNIRLREQRHDYLNQIQIVYGLLELEEYESAREYLQPVFKDIMKVNRALRTAHPAVNALLQAKMEEAERQQIDFYLEVSTQLKQLSVEPWEFCKILANLIDNAVTAVLREDFSNGENNTRLQQQKKEKWIRLRMEERPDGYCILIENNGPEIPKQQQKLIFHRGFTTKKGEGHGQGLAIVSSILKEVNGSIVVESSEEETAFLVQIPKKEKSVDIGKTTVSVKRKKMTG